MSSLPQPDKIVVERIRAGDTDAWGELIARYEGRLLAFVRSRLGRKHAGEDIVQETFIGFLTSLPNYDGKRPLESYLFSICAYKLTDHLRREGRRPAVSLSAAGAASDGDWEPAAMARMASSLVRSGERRELEAEALAAALREQVDQWRRRGSWDKIQCMELLFVRGWPNKRVAEELALTEQQVANLKFDFLARLRNQLRKQRISQDIFPDLYSK